MQSRGYYLSCFDVGITLIILISACGTNSQNTHYFSKSQISEA